MIIANAKAFVMDGKANGFIVSGCVFSGLQPVLGCNDASRCPRSEGDRGWELGARASCVWERKRERERGVFSIYQ